VTTLSDDTQSRSGRADYSPWQAPEVDDSRHLEPADIEKARKQAHEDGYRDGYAAGLLAGSDAAAENAQYLHEIVEALAKPFEELDDSVTEGMVALITAVAGQLVRRQIQIDPSHVISVVREGLACLPAAERNVRIVVNPMDAELIRNKLMLDDKKQSWTLQPDPMMQRGSCELIAESARVDGRLETRLRRLVAKMIHDGREDFSV